MEKQKKQTSSRWCAIPTCREHGKGSRFFSFPKDETRALQWIERCARNDLLKKDISTLWKNTHLCSRHFENHMFLNDLKNRLQSHAIPTLFLPTSVSCTATSEPSISDANIQDIVPQQSTDQHSHEFGTGMDIQSEVETYVETDTETRPETELEVLSHCSVDGSTPSTSSVGLQTNKSLSADSPRKRKENILKYWYF